jgi:hypothetical protein
MSSVRTAQSPENYLKSAGMSQVDPFGLATHGATIVLTDANPSFGESPYQKERDLFGLFKAGHPHQKWDRNYWFGEPRDFASLGKGIGVIAGSSGTGITTLGTSVSISSGTWWNSIVPLEDEDGNSGVGPGYFTQPVLNVNLNRVLGHAGTPKSSFHVLIFSSGGSDSASSVSNIFTVINTPGAATWRSFLDNAESPSYPTLLIHSRLRSLIRSSSSENFESGYESRYRQQLREIFATYRLAFLDVLYENLKVLDLPSDLFAETFKFVSRLDDKESYQSRLLFLLPFLHHSSTLVRDAAGSALYYLGDPAAAPYFREAAKVEPNPALRSDFLEIAALLEE